MIQTYHISGTCTCLNVVVLFYIWKFVFVAGKIMSNTDCVICKEAIQDCDAIQTIFDKGHASILAASASRDDNLHIDVEDLEKPYQVHVRCFKDYTRRTPFAAVKRKLEAGTVADETVLLRSKTLDFKFKENSLFCAKQVGVNTKCPKSRRRDFSCVETVEFLPSLVTAARERNDKWGNEVLVRIQSCCDLVAEEAR